MRQKLAFARPGRIGYRERMPLIRKVVDSNFLRNPALAQYLGRSRSNIAVLTEFVLLEAHKRNPLVTVPNSVAILSRYSSQVAILRPSGNLLGFPGRSAGLQQRLIDQRRSQEFPRFCRQVRDAAAGDLDAQSIVLDTARVATTHIDGLIDAAPTIIELFRGHVGRFGPDELRALRSQQPRSWDLQRKLFDIVFESATDVAVATRAVPSTFQPEEVVNLPVFRYCLCMMLLFIRWIEGGRQTASSNASIANDVVDANIAAYSTYFHGVLSADDKVNSLAREARHVLREIGGAVP